MLRADLSTRRHPATDGIAKSGTDLTMTTSDGVRLVYHDESEGRPILLGQVYDGLRHWDEMCS